MRILITNDDGISAPGLKILTHIATELAGSQGEVWTVAPATEQSGIAHAVSYSRPMEVEHISDRVYAINGSPADCVLATIYHILPDGVRPDLVLSGVNPGNNSGENTLYSGTVGAAIEAVLQGIPGIALSQFIGPETKDSGNIFDAAAVHGARLIRKILDCNIFGVDDDYGVFYNVNFPPLLAKNVKGTKVATQGFRRNALFHIEEQTSPSGRSFLWAKGGYQHEKTLPDSDVTANLDGFISITPMRADLTAHDLLNDLTVKLA